jgi:hypothetical protein
MRRMASGQGMVFRSMPRCPVTRRSIRQIRQDTSAKARYELKITRTRIRIIELIKQILYHVATAVVPGHHK